MNLDLVAASHEDVFRSRYASLFERVAAGDRWYLASLFRPEPDINRVGAALAIDGGIPILGATILDGAYAGLAALSPDGSLEAVVLIGRGLALTDPETEFWARLAAQLESPAACERERAALIAWLSSAGLPGPLSSVAELLADESDDDSPEDTVDELLRRSGIGSLEALLEPLLPVPGRFDPASVDFIHPVTERDRFIAAARDGYIGVFDTEEGSEPVAKHPMSRDGWNAAVAEALKRSGSKPFWSSELKQWVGPS